MPNRSDEREASELRAIGFTLDFQKHPAGSVMVEFGATRVICSVTITPGVPRWMREQGVGGGWLTAEYQMLPGATAQRTQRESARLRPAGRNSEIQRLIGRSLRAVLDLTQIPDKTLHVDCDVIDADGGTRCAAISGASLALELALQKCFVQGTIAKWPLRDRVAAVSVGMVDGAPLLDLCYEEDVAADVDMNVVMTTADKFVEVQGTAEGALFSLEEMTEMVALARNGLAQVFECQKQAMTARDQ